MSEKPTGTNPKTSFRIGISFFAILIASFFFLGTALADNYAVSVGTQLILRLYNAAGNSAANDTPLTITGDIKNSDPQNKYGIYLNSDQSHLSNNVPATLPNQITTSSNFSLVYPVIPGTGNTGHRFASDEEILSTGPNPTIDMGTSDRIIRAYVSGGTNPGCVNSWPTSILYCSATSTTTAYNMQEQNAFAYIYIGKENGEEFLFEQKMSSDKTTVPNSDDVITYSVFQSSTPPIFSADSLVAANLHLGDSTPFGKIIAYYSPNGANLGGTGGGGTGGADCWSATAESPIAPCNDTDRDGVPTYDSTDSNYPDNLDQAKKIDNCPYVSNPDQRDSDGDGMGDACQPVDSQDSDSDGVADYLDPCDDNPNVRNTAEMINNGNSCSISIDRMSAGDDIWISFHGTVKLNGSMAPGVNIYMPQMGGAQVGRTDTPPDANVTNNIIFEPYPNAPVFDQFFSGIPGASAVPEASAEESQNKICTASDFYYNPGSIGYGRTVVCKVKDATNYLRSQPIIYLNEGQYGSLQFKVWYLLTDELGIQFTTPIEKTIKVPITRVTEESGAGYYVANVDMSINLVPKIIFMYGQALATNREGRKFPLIPVRVEMPSFKDYIAPLTLGETFAGSEAYNYPADSGNTANNFGAYKGFFEFSKNKIFGSGADSNTFTNYYSDIKGSFTNCEQLSPVSSDTPPSTLPGAKLGIFCTIIGEMGVNTITFPLQYVYIPNGKIIRLQGKQFPFYDFDPAHPEIYNKWDLSLEATTDEINNSIGSNSQSLGIASLKSNIILGETFEVVVTGGLGPWTVDGGPFLKYKGSRIIQGSSLSSDLFSGGSRIFSFIYNSVSSLITYTANIIADAFNYLWDGISYIFSMSVDYSTRLVRQLDLSRLIKMNIASAISQAAPDDLVLLYFYGNVKSGDNLPIPKNSTKPYIELRLEPFTEIFARSTALSSLNLDFNSYESPTVHPVFKDLNIDNSPFDLNLAPHCYSTSFANFSIMPFLQMLFGSTTPPSYSGYPSPNTYLNKDSTSDNVAVCWITYSQAITAGLIKVGTDGSLQSNINIRYSSSDPTTLPLEPIDEDNNIIRNRSSQLYSYNPDNSADTTGTSTALRPLIEALFDNGTSNNGSTIKPYFISFIDIGYTHLDLTDTKTKAQEFLGEFVLSQIVPPEAVDIGPSICRPVTTLSNSNSLSYINAVSDNGLICEFSVDPLTFTGHEQVALISVVDALGQVSGTTVNINVPKTSLGIYPQITTVPQGTKLELIGLGGSNIPSNYEWTVLPQSTQVNYGVPVISLPAPVFRMTTTTSNTAWSTLPIYTTWILDPSRRYDAFIYNTSGFPQNDISGKIYGNFRNNESQAYADRSTDTNVHTVNFSDNISIPASNTGYIEKSFYFYGQGPNSANRRFGIKNIQSDYNDDTVYVKNITSSSDQYLKFDLVVNPKQTFNESKLLSITIADRTGDGSCGTDFSTIEDVSTCPYKDYVLNIYATSSNDRLSIDTSNYSVFSTPISIKLHDKAFKEDAYAGIYVTPAQPVGLIISHSVCTSNIESVTWSNPSNPTNLGSPPDFSSIRWSSTPSLNFSDVTSAQTGDILPFCAYALLSNGQIQNVTAITDFHESNNEAGQVLGSGLKITKGGANIVTGSLTVTLPTQPAQDNTNASGNTASTTSTGTGSQIITATIRSINAINVSSSDGLQINPGTATIRSRPSNTIDNFNDVSPLSIQEFSVTGGEDSNLFIWSVPHNESGGCLIKGHYPSYIPATPTSTTSNPFPCFDQIVVPGTESRYVGYIAGSTLGHDTIEVTNTNIGSLESLMPPRYDVTRSNPVSLTLEPTPNANTGAYIPDPNRKLIVLDATTETAIGSIATDDDRYYFNSSFGQLNQGQTYIEKTFVVENTTGSNINVHVFPVYKGENPSPQAEATTYITKIYKDAVTKKLYISAVFRPNTYIAGPENPNNRELYIFVDDQTTPAPTFYRYVTILNGYGNPTIPVSLERTLTKSKAEIDIIESKPDSLTIQLQNTDQSPVLTPQFYIGESANIKVLDEFAKDYTPFVTLTSSNTAVATIADRGINFVGQGATTITATLKVGSSDAVVASTIVSSVALGVTPASQSIPRRGTSGATPISYPFSLSNPLSSSSSGYAWALSGNGCISSATFTTTTITSCSKTVTDTDEIFYLPSQSLGQDILSFRDTGRSAPPVVVPIQIIDNQAVSLSIGKVSGSSCTAATSAITGLVYNDQISLCALATYEDGSTQNVTPFVEWHPLVQDIGTFQEGTLRITNKLPGIATVSAVYTSGNLILASQPLEVNSLGGPRFNIDTLTMTANSFDQKAQSFQFYIVNSGSFANDTYEWEITGSGGGLLSVDPDDTTKAVYTAGSRPGTVTITAVSALGKGSAQAVLTLQASPVVSLYISHNFPKPYKDAKGQYVTDALGQPVLWSDRQCNNGLNQFVMASSDSGIATNFRYSVTGTGGTVSSIRVNFSSSIDSPNVVKLMDSRSSFTYNLSGGDYIPGYAQGETGRDIFTVFSGNQQLPVMKFWFDVSPAGINNPNGDIFDVIFYQQAFKADSMTGNPPDLEGLHVGDRVPMCASGLLESGAIVDLTDKVRWISTNKTAADFDTPGNLLVKDGGQSSVRAFLDIEGGASSIQSQSIGFVGFDRLKIAPADSTVSTNSYFRFSVTGGYVGGDDFTYPDHPFSISISGANTSACVAGKAAYNNDASGDIIFGSRVTAPYSDTESLLNQLQNNVTGLSGYSSSLLSQQSLTLSECRSYIELADPRALQDMYLYSGAKAGAVILSVSDGYSEVKTNITIVQKSYAFIGIAPTSVASTITKKSNVKTNLSEYGTVSQEIGESIPLSLLGSESLSSNLEEILETATWSSSDPSIIGIDANGIAKILDTGTSSITATLNGVTSKPIIIAIPGKPLIKQDMARFYPPIVLPGRTTTLSVFVADAKGSDNLNLVSADLTKLNIVPTTGSFTFARGQESGSGAWYTISFKIPTSASSSTYKVNVTARNNKGQSSADTQVSATLMVVDRVIPGDLNGDGYINLKDAVIAMKISVDPTNQTIVYNPSADINGDGKIGLAEAVYALRKVAGLL